jgi:hypothetical protein
MDPLLNPYTPGAGTVPPVLAGREHLVDRFTFMLDRLSLGHHEQSLMVTGLRGVGKTVLLEHLADIAREKGWYAQVEEVTPDTELAPLMMEQCRRALFAISRKERVRKRAHQAFGVLASFIKSAKIETDAGDLVLDFELVRGRGDSGNLVNDLIDLLQEVGEVAKEAGQGVVLLLDEVQYLKKADLASLIMALHKVGRMKLPLAVVGAGLPMIPELAGTAKSYAERLFEFPRIGQLAERDARSALQEPAVAAGAFYTDEALAFIIERTHGYPFFLQCYGRFAWATGSDDVIDLEAAERADELAMDFLDRDLFRVRFNRATPKEREYLMVMAQLQAEGAVVSGQAVAERMGYEKVDHANVIRAKLIRKGLVYAPEWGLLAFTVPMFEEFLGRIATEGGES